MRWNTKILDDMTYVWNEDGMVVVSWVHRSSWRSMRFFGSIGDNLHNEMDSCLMEVVKGADVITPSVQFLSFPDTSTATFDESLPMPDWSWGVDVAFDVLSKVRDGDISGKWYAENLGRIVYLGLLGYNSYDTLQIIESE